MRALSPLVSHICTHVDPSNGSSYANSAWCEDGGTAPLLTHLGLSLGDNFTFSNPLLRDGQRAGTSYNHCVVTQPGPISRHGALCAAVLAPLARDGRPQARAAWAAAAA